MLGGKNEKFSVAQNDSFTKLFDRLMFLLGSTQAEAVRLEFLKEGPLIFFGANILISALCKVK